VLPACSSRPVLLTTPAPSRRPAPPWASASHIGIGGRPGTAPELVDASAIFVIAAQDSAWWVPECDAASITIASPESEAAHTRALATEQCFSTVAQGVGIIKTFMARSRQTLGIAECNSRSRREQYLLNELRRKDETNTKTSRSRPEPLARQYYSTSVKQRVSKALHRGVIGNWTHFESHHFRPCHQKQH
jgi:hypothetical protein